MRELKRKSPDKKCVIDQEQLYADGKIFIYDLIQQKVVEIGNTTDANVKRTKSSSKDDLPSKVKNLESLVQKQLKMIQEQQKIIEKQKHLLYQGRQTQRRQFDDSKLLEESLEELIDREEISEEDECMM